MTYRPASVPCPLYAAATTSPDAPAIAGVNGTLSYRELNDCVSEAAQRLRERGYGPGMRVALYLPKSESYIVLLLALIRTGAVSCPLSTRFPVQRIAPLLERAGCGALISEDEDALGAEISGVEKLKPEELLSEKPKLDSRQETLVLDRPATIVFTSGSTSEPKAALHTFGNHYFNALGSNENIPLAPGDRWLLSLPLYHVGGLSIIFRCLLAGATMTLPGPEPASDSLAKRGITHASLVSTQLKRLLEEPRSFGALKEILLGGSEIPLSLLDRASKLGLPVRTSYGLTEMASQVSTTVNSSPEELRTSGRVLPHREVGISEEGEILVRGETLFAGYLDGDTVTRPLDDEGWFHTRDLGSLDEAGYLHVRGRKDNMFVSGGENIQPEEIEEVMRGLEGVERAVVVPIPDAEFGFRPIAFVLGAQLEPEKLAASLSRLLPRFKVPVAFHEWPGEADPEAAKVDRTFFGEYARRVRG